MKLKFIKTEKCPICGCDVIINESVEKELYSTKIREHANGGRWEYRKFACGCEISYVPNFSREEVIGQCIFDPKKIEREKKRSTAKDMLYVEIDKLDVDKEFKSRLKDSIKYI